MDYMVTFEEYIQGKWVEDIMLSFTKEEQQAIYDYLTAQEKHFGRIRNIVKGDFKVEMPEGKKIIIERVE